jgi:septal ring factor EnvC (AmiA/AmiB activator)
VYHIDCSSIYQAKITKRYKKGFPKSTKGVRIKFANEDLTIAVNEDQSQMVLQRIEQFRMLPPFVKGTLKMLSDEVMNDKKEKEKYMRELTEMKQTYEATIASLQDSMKEKDIELSQYKQMMSQLAQDLRSKNKEFKRERKRFEKYQIWSQETIGSLKQAVIHLEHQVGTPQYVPSPSKAQSESIFQNAKVLPALPAQMQEQQLPREECVTVVPTEQQQQQPDMALLEQQQQEQQIPIQIQEHHITLPATDLSDNLVSEQQPEIAQSIPDVATHQPVEEVEEETVPGDEFNFRNLLKRFSTKSMKQPAPESEEQEGKKRILVGAGKRVMF